MRTIIIALLFVSSLLNAQYPDGKILLDRIDANLSATNRVMTSKMIVIGARTTRTIESKSWIVGEEKSFTEYLAPAREQGTKMLKLEDQHI